LEKQLIELTQVRHANLNLPEGVIVMDTLQRHRIPDIPLG
jgi:hypothetical protein